MPAASTPTCICKCSWNIATIKETEIEFWTKIWFTKYNKKIEISVSYEEESNQSTR